MKIEDRGADNRVVQSDIGEGVRLAINGNRNLVSIGDRCRINQGDWTINGDDNRLTIANSVTIGALRIICQDGSSITIGTGSTIEQAYILSRDGRSVRIGKDCMISFQVDLRTSDAHGIFDLDTGEQINEPGDIDLEDHVWIAQGVIVSKSSRIGRGSLVGSRSFVQKVEIPANTMAAGTPCRILKRGIRWARSMDGRQ